MNCMFCGALAKPQWNDDRGVVWFECGTMYQSGEGNRFDQKEKCAEAEREAMRQKIASLEAKVSNEDLIVAAYQVVARRIINRLVADISDRAGIKHAWRAIDDAVMHDELLPEWERLIADELSCGRFGGKNILKP